MPKKPARRKSSAKKKKLLFWHRGNVAFYLLIIIVIIGAYFLVGGFSGFNNSNVDKTPAGEVIKDPPSVERDSLQLQTLRFKKCSSQLTVDLLLDVSGSMNDNTGTFVPKITRLKQAVNNLISKLTDSSVVGIQTFRGVGGGQDQEPQSQIVDLVPISYYKDIKNNIASKVNSIYADGATPTYDALAFSYGKLSEGVKKFPDRKFNFVLISDGAPCPTNCPGIPGKDQDPRKYSPNPADQIKDLGVNVYTIGIYSKNQSTDPNLEGLLKSIASKPENYKNAGSGDAIDPILKEVAEKICSETGK